MADDFNQAEYWIKRHEDLKGDPRSVGTLAASREANEEGEREYKIVVSHLAKHLANQGAKSVLDLGCGYGRITSCFIENDFEYTGVDISPVAIETAKKTHSKARFFTGNLSELDLGEKFDVVTVLYVFVHFVDDILWRSFLSAAIDRVKPGGTLVFADIFPSERTPSGRHVVSRPLSDYTRAFKEDGMVFDDHLRDVAKGTRISCGNHFYFAHPDPMAKEVAGQIALRTDAEFLRDAIIEVEASDALPDSDKVRVLSRVVAELLKREAGKLDIKV